MTQILRVVSSSVMMILGSVSINIATASGPRDAGIG
jgi:hypothetical protein